MYGKDTLIVTMMSFEDMHLLWLRKLYLICIKLFIIAKDSVGFSGTLGPSHQQGTIFFKTLANQQKVFLQRYDGGIGSTHMVANHHYNVPARFQIDDKWIRQKFSLLDGIFTMMNK